MADLAIILGEKASVHFVEIEEGSTVLVHKADFEAVPKINERVAKTRNGEGPHDAMAAYRSTNKRLRDDNGTANLIAETAEILPFPGRDAAVPLMFPAFTQSGTLDGKVIRIGGRDEIVPVHLDAGTRIYPTCKAHRSVAKRLAVHIFGAELRVVGSGRWHVDDIGTWILDSFYIQDFEVLDEEPLQSVVSALRATEGSDWEKTTDPWRELNELRHGEGDLN